MASVRRKRCIPIWSGKGDFAGYAVIEEAMPKDYIEVRNGGYYVADARVSLDSVVYAYLRGESPEGIAESFPALTLTQIFGALAYYAANREKVDRYLSASRAEFEIRREQWRRNHPALHKKLVAARQRSQVPGA